MRHNDNIRAYISLFILFLIIIIVYISNEIGKHYDTRIKEGIKTGEHVEYINGVRYFKVRGSYGYFTLCPDMSQFDIKRKEER